MVLHDVTALRRLEQVRRDFVANVSHELKTPLMVETMLDDPDMEIETGRRFLRRIADQAVRLSTLVTDLLTLARIESTQAGPEPRALDLADPLRECVTRIQPLCQQKDVRLAVELPQEPMPLHADEEDLRQIFGNLLDNAVKYTPAGGHVTLRAEPEGGEARVRITDTGLGIEPRDQERIFERFYRVDKARSRELGGTGLGLAIVKHLVLTAGGRVAVESTPGRGSCFSVHLPLNEPS